MGWRLASLGTCLLLAGSAPARAAVITPEVVSTFPTPGGSIVGLAWGDGSLWVADENQKIYRLSPTGTVQGSFSHTITEVSDLEWFENSLWVHDGYQVYKLDSTGQVVETLNVGYWPGSGMAWAEGDLYLTDYNSAYVHKLTRAGSHVYSWSVGYSGGHPMAMTYDGSHLWILDSCEGTQQIRSWSLTGIQGDSVDLALLGTCTPGIATPKGLTWDGRYFWYAYGLNIYKLNTGGDDVPPTASVVSPSGGEYWLLSDAGSPPHTQVVTWSMSDNIRICQVRASLWYSNDGGTSYLESPAGGGLPATFGPGGSCTGQGERTTSLVYTVPTSPPSGTSGSLYKVQVEVTDHAGNTLVLDPQSGLHAVRSANPFYVVRSNADSVRTLILSNTGRMVSRMGISAGQASALSYKLQELAAHPKVQGFVVDLGGVTDLSQPTSGLYAVWDGDPSNPAKANNVLFGCHGPDLEPPEPLPSGCAAVKEGIHDRVRELLAIYTGVKYLIVVGDDRIVPLARMQDRTVLLPEQSYPSAGPGQDLTATGTTVGQALAANKYLSDDPLAVIDAVRTDDLSGSLFLPDLAVGRLVETPEEMIRAIATFISQDGVLDVSVLDPASGHKVLVTGYDFLMDAAKKVRARWKSALGVSTPDGSLSPVDGSLIGGTWGLGTVADRRTALRTHLGGNGGARYAVSSLLGHATHYEEGVPGTDAFHIEGLATRDVYGPDQCDTPGAGPLSLAGGFVYAVGCHGGLPVAGSCASDADHSLDLPQTMLSRGVVAYVANTGYGWGLKFGVGYGERLMELLTEQLSKGGTVVTGEALRQTKLRYYLETPRYDPYDEKTLMQWTFFGLPMYAVKTGIAAGTADERAFEGRAPGAAERTPSKRMGGVSVEQAVVRANVLPGSLVQLNLHFDLTGPGVYSKWSASGDPLPMTPGCASLDGCYYTLNGLVERSSGAGDLPVQPYLVYDSRLSGTSQHGVLWKGGTYEEESGWIPVLGELVSNGGDGSNHGGAPRVSIIRPTAPRTVPGQNPEQCRPSDLEMNSLVVGAGEAVKGQEAEPVYSIERRYREIDLEAFYFNDAATPSNNCDREGPALGTGPHGGAYHRVSGTTMEWAVPATDASGVWRVVVVVNDNTVDGQGRGAWSAVELADDGSGTWRGSRVVSGASMVTYVIQAVDRRGNLTWLDYTSTQLPSSGVPLGVPKTVDVPLVGPPSADLSVTMADDPDPVVALGTLTYTIVVGNGGPSAASSVGVVQTLPAGVTFMTASGSGWSCTAAATVSCTRGSLASGTTAPPILVQVTVGEESATLESSVTVTAPESDPTVANNTAVTRTTVQGATAPPDLVVSVTSVSPDPGAPGEPVTVGYQVANQGGSGAGANGLRLWLSRDGFLDTGVDSPLPPDAAIPALPAGQSLQATATRTMPSGIGAGLWYVVAQVDPDNAVAEGSETNNTGVRAVHVLPPKGSLDFYTVTPCRLVDTRDVTGPSGGPALAGSSTRSFPVTGGACGIPSTATAISVNLTAVGAVAGGYFTVFPGDASAAPLASSLNFTPGVTRANNAVVPLATDGSGTIKVKNGSAGTVDFVLDVNGYFQ